MNRIAFVFFVLFSTASVHAQSLLAKFKKLSGPEKCWVIFHPFVASRALQATLQTQRVTDSIRTTGLIGSDNIGGQLDAFKHAYWIGNVSAAIGTRKALKLGVAHEKGNYRQFKKHQLEDQELPDSVSSCMDLYNNEQGAKTVQDHPGIGAEALQKLMLEQLEKGQMRCILKNLKGEFLTCDGKIIHLEEWYGKWNIPKCLVPSNAYQQ
jgi:hypothetical protein